MSDKKTVQTLFCEKCGRELGPELLECPERSKGECPYTVEKEYGLWRGIRQFLFGILALVIAFVCIDLIKQYFPGISFIIEAVSELVGTISLVTGLFLITSGVNIASKKSLRCSHAVTGQAWMQTYRFGIKSAQTITSAFQPVEFETALSRPLNFPASISALCNYREDDDEWTLFIADLYYVTLLHLLHQKAIRLYYTKWSYHHKGIWRVRERFHFILVLNSSETSSQLKGTLEQKIIQTIKEYSFPQEYFGAFPSEIELLPPRLPLEYFHLLYLCAQKRKIRSSFTSPNRELFSELIAEEAVRRELGVLKKIKYNRKKRLKLFPQSQEKLSADYRLMQELHEGFLDSYPEIAREFRKTLIQMVEQEESSK